MLTTLVPKGTLVPKPKIEREEAEKTKGAGHSIKAIYKHHCVLLAGLPSAHRRMRRVTVLSIRLF